MGLDRLEKRARKLKAEAIKEKSAPTDPIERLEQGSGKRRHADRDDLDRILALPVVEPLSPVEVEEISRQQVLARPFKDGFRLQPDQASAVAAYLEAGGGFFPIGVGRGKTGISIMCAEAAYQKGLQKIMLLIEPGCLGQLVKVDIPFWRRKVPISIPFHVVGGRSLAARRQIYRSGYRGCYIVPYSYLSVADTMEMLEGIDPDLVIADECHNLKNPRAAQTKRFIHMMGEREREFVAMSGTVTSKSIHDYRHFLLWALRERAPIPLSTGTARAWSAALDSGARITGHHMTGPLEPLVRWAIQHFPEERFRLTLSDLRKAYKRRLESAPGVVASGDACVGASLSIENVHVPEERYTSDPKWDSLQALIDRVKDDYQTPNGDEIQCDLHIFKWLVELSTGFYNELIWPTPEQVASKHSISEGEALDALNAAFDAYGLHQYYSKLLRQFLEESPAGLDTPMLVGRAISSGEIGGELAEAFKDWHFALKEIEQRFGFVPERYKRAVRVCPFKINEAVRWCKEFGTKGALLWVWHREIGRWLVDALTEAGLEPVHCPAGENDTIREIGDPSLGGKGDRIVVASMRSHGTGKNLQAFPAQLVVQWPRVAQIAEQFLGRVHRLRVEEFRDHVAVHSLNITPWDHLNMAACLNDAVYQHQTQNPRKMLIATYNPLPRIFTPEFLREQGTSPKMLDVRQRQMMEDKFGSDWESNL